MPAGIYRAACGIARDVELSAEQEVPAKRAATVNEMTRLREYFAVSVQWRQKASCGSHVWHHHAENLHRAQRVYAARGRTGGAMHSSRLKVALQKVGIPAISNGKNLPYPTVTTLL